MAAPAFDRTLLRTPRTADPDGLLYVPELVPVVTPPGGVMTRPWLDWARRLTAKLAEVGTGGGGGGGTGDVVGPAGATPDAIALYSGSTGKLIKDSLKTIAALTADILAAVLPGGLLPLSALPAHHTRHEPGGSDPMAVDAAAAVGSLRTLGTGATQAAPGNDARFTTVVAHHATHEPGGSDALQLSGASRLVGRGSAAGAGAVQEITLGPGLAMSDTVLTMTTGAGVGDVFGPASATPDNLAAYADPTGKVIKDAGIPTAQVARRDQANSFVHADQRIYSNGQPRLTIVDNFQPASQRAFRVINTAQALSVQALDDALTTVQATPLALTRAGSATVGNHLTVTGNGTVTGTGGNVACKDQANVFTDPAQQIGPAAAPRLSFSDTGQPADARVFRIMNSVQVLEFGALNDAQTVVQTQPLRLGRAGDASVGRDLYEKGRTTALGHWIDQPFNAANFAGLSGMTWTVASGSVGINHYTRVGRMLTWVFRIEASPVGGTASPFLTLAIPGALTASKANDGICQLVAGDGGGPVAAFGAVWAGNLQLVLVQKPTGAVWAGSVSLYGTMTLETTT